ncbi:MAG: helix-turn-helix domain-containing protein [Elusimicrobia bacterium]|nr:helix-turn-helix domain-containing protein [Elusimicrobiota bacterium]
MEDKKQVEIMDVRQLSQYLGIGKSKIYNLIRQRKIPASRIGRQYRFSKEVVDHWLKEKIISVGPDFQMSLLEKQEK